MKRIIKSLIIIFFLLALGGYETYAQRAYGCHCWDRCWDKKKVDLKVDYEGYYNKEVDGDPNAGYWPPRNLRCENFFDFDDIKPGDFGEGTISLHLRKQDAWGCAIIRPTKNDDKRSTEPELLVDEQDRRRDKWDGELAQNLNFKIWADICDVSPASVGDNIFQPDCDRMLTSGSGPLENLKFALADSANPNVFTNVIEPLKKKGKYYLGVEWNIPQAVGNVVQTDVYKADVEFFVQQSKNNDYFECEDINPNNPRRCADGASRECYAGPSGTKDVGICQSGNQTCFHGKWSRCKGQVTPKREICDDGLDNDCDGEVDEQKCIIPCSAYSDCDDGNDETWDKCIRSKCEFEKKYNFYDFCWIRGCR